MQLPVQPQLGENVAGMAGGAAGDLAVDGVVAEADALVGLGDLGEIVVGDFRHGIAALVDVVADLVGDAPAEEVAAAIAAILVQRDGLAAAQTGHRIPADADVVARRIHEGAGKHPHIPDIQVLGGQTVLVPCPGQVGQALVLVEQDHHLVHGVHRAEQAGGLVGRGTAAQTRQQLADRHRVHHLIQQHVGGVEDAGLGLIGTVVAVQFVVTAVQAVGRRFQGRHVGGDALLALGRVVDAVEVQHGDGFPAADPHRVAVIGTVAGILHIEGTAVLGVKGDQLGDHDLVAAHLELDRLGDRLARFGVVLGGYQLQPGVGAGGHIAAAHVDDDLLSGPGGDAQGLPGVEPGEAQVTVLLGRDGGMHLHHIAEGGGQQAAGVVQLLLQGLPLGVQLTAGLVGGVQAGLQRLDGLLVHPVAQRHMQVIGIEGQDVVLQAVVGVEPHLRDGDGAVIIDVSHTDPQVIGGDTAGDLDGVVVLAAVAVLGNGHAGHLVFTAVLPAGEQAHIAVGAPVLGGGQRQAADMVAGVKGDAHTAVVGVGGAVVPVVQTVPGGEVVVHHAPGGLAGIQRAVLHVAGLVGHRRDVRRDLPCRAHRVDEPVGRQLHRADIGRGRRGGQRGGTFAQLVDAGDVHLIDGVVFQVLDGVAVLVDAGHLGEVGIPLFAVVDIVAVGVLHVLPGGFDALEPPGQAQGVGGGGQFVRLGHHRDGLAVAAAPSAVHRLHPHGVGLAVLQFLAAEGGHRQRVGRRADRLGLSVKGDLHLIAGDVHRRVPGQCEGLTFRLGRKAGGDVHGGRRDAGFHIVEEFHLGDFRQAAAPRNRRNFNGDLLDGDLAAEVHRDGAVGLHRGRPQEAGDQRTAHRDGHGLCLTVFLVLHQHGGAADSVLRCGRGLEHHTGHGHRRLGRFLKVKADRDGVFLRDSGTVGGLQRHGAVAGEQILQTAADHLGGFFFLQSHQAFGDPHQHRGSAVPRLFQGGRQHLQVHQVRRAAAVQVGHTGLSPFDGIDQNTGVPVSELAVAVHIADAQGTGMEAVRRVGVAGQEPGVELHAVELGAHLQGLGIGGKAAALHRQGVLALGQVPEAHLTPGRFTALRGGQRDGLGLCLGAVQAHREVGVPLQRQTRQQRHSHLRRILRGLFRPGCLFLCIGLFLRRGCFLQQFRGVLLRRLFVGRKLRLGGSGLPGGAGRRLRLVRFRGLQGRLCGEDLFRQGGRALGQDAQQHAAAQQGGDGSFHLIPSFRWADPIESALGCLCAAHILL